MSFWKKYLHMIRGREVELISDFLKSNNVHSCIEFGAGDGFQTGLLSRYFSRYVSTDLNMLRLENDSRVSGVEYRKIDADDFRSQEFSEKFDIVFSSNMLEHLQRPTFFVRESFNLLKENGYAIHIVPSRWIKISYISLYYLYLAQLFFSRVINYKKNKRLFGGFSNHNENNINAPVKKYSKIRKIFRILTPSIHGNYETHYQEFIAYGKESWLKLFQNNGYKLYEYKKGPAFSGFGFGISGIRKFLEMCGVFSEHIFILQKTTDFEYVARQYTAYALPRSSYYEFEKFVGDWMRKEKSGTAFVRDFSSAVGNPSQKKVLDIGFGNAIILSHFIQAGALGFGLETEEKLLAIGQKTLDSKKIQADLRLYDGKHFPFEDSFFDYMYCTSVLEHMSWPQEVLQEVARTLKKDGTCYISFPNKYAIQESHTGLYGISMLPRWVTQIILRIFRSSPLEDWNLHFISYFKFKKMLKRANLEIVFDNTSQNKYKYLIKQILSRLGIHYGMFLKTIIVSVKRK